MTRLQRNGCQGFTLVEMMVVIVIIGILAGLITGVAIRARRKAEITRVGTILADLDRALQEYKNKVGEYPPDGTDNIRDLNSNNIPDSFERHFRKRFPRAILTDPVNRTGEIELLQDNYEITVDFVNNYTPATSLVFWLGGVPQDRTNPRSPLMGFSKNPIRPLSDLDPNSSRENKFYDFDAVQLNGPAGRLFRAYYANDTGSGTMPFIYFRAERGVTRGREYYWRDSSGNFVLKGYTFQPDAKPYWDDRTRSWVNAESCQILYAGVDNRFGAGNCFPSGILPTTNPPTVPVPNTELLPYTEENDDDQANFITGTMVDEME